MVRAVILGTGDESHALCHLFKNYNTASSGNYLEVTKPSIQKGGKTLHETGVLISELHDSLARANIVILAIPAKALRTFVSDHLQILKDKILVDVSNSWTRGEDLNSILSMTDVRFVKAFNDLGAVDLLLDKPTSKDKIQTKVCSKYSDAADAVKGFAEESLGLDVKLIPYERYSDIAQHQQSLGENWIKAAILIVVVFAIAELYAILRYNVFKGYDWYHVLIQVTNKAVCWTALDGFAIAQLPGVLARMYNMIYADNLRSKPAWLQSFLSIRKHLGLLSLWFLMVHILMSLLIFNPGYYSKFFIEKSGKSKLNAIGEASFFFAIFGTAFYFILGICSLPSIGSQMTNYQWQLIYGPLAWVALVCGTVHVMIMGVKGWNKQETWPGGMPPITLTSVLIPLTIMTIKFVQLVSTRVIWKCIHPKTESVRQELEAVGHSQLTMPNLVDDFQDPSRRTLSSDENGNEYHVNSISDADIITEESVTSRALVPVHFDAGTKKVHLTGATSSNSSSSSLQKKKTISQKQVSKIPDSYTHLEA